jgi:hypothetical protein
MTMTTKRPRRARLGVGAAALAGALALAACGGGSTPSTNGASGTAAPSATGTGGSSAGQVLPVTSNPITNTATAQTLSIDSVLVENNEDGSGNAVDDHLEVGLTNTGATDLTGFEAYYTFTDPTAGTAESYYADLTDFTIPAGESRTVHFDNTGATDHYPVNEFSLYYTSLNALEVQVEISAQGAATQTSTVQKDAGGAEVPD